MATVKKAIKTEELDNVEQMNKENGEVVGGQGNVFGGNIKRKKGESQQAYNERVPVAYQPAQETPKYSYLGKKL